MNASEAAERGIAFAFANARAVVQVSRRRQRERCGGHSNGIGFVRHFRQQPSRGFRQRRMLGRQPFVSLAAFVQRRRGDDITAIGFYVDARGNAVATAQAHALGQSEK